MSYSTQESSIFLAVLYLDLETGGFDIYKNEILQVSMKSGFQSYNSYVTPTRPINSKALEVHCLTKLNKNL